MTPEALVWTVMFSAFSVAESLLNILIHNNNKSHNELVHFEPRRLRMILRPGAGFAWIDLIQLNVPISDPLNGVCKWRSVGARGLVLLNLLRDTTVNSEIFTMRDLLPRKAGYNDSPYPDFE
jgi:hypothetical protein